MERTFPNRGLSLLFCLASFLAQQPPALSVTSDTIVLSGINTEVYSRPGDINIGAIMMLSNGANEFGCSKNMYPNSWNIEYSEAVAFAVEKVNKDNKLLPNITLGFYLLDDCSDRKVALAQALTFLPRDQLFCSAGTCNGTATPAQTYPLSPSFNSTPIPHYNVMGILAPLLSISAIPVSFLLSAAKMPIVGFTTTSEELSDNSLHPYFLRVVTSDKYQAIAMLKFISSNGWSYISVVYSAGSYGERAYETLKIFSPHYNICIATSNRVTNEENTDHVAEDLLKYPRARVVILFADELPVRNLFASVERLNETGRFIWVCCDSVTTASVENLRNHLNSITGAFLFLYNTAYVSEFYDYIRRQNVSTSPNPWFQPSWENTADCSFAKNTCDPEADITKMTNFQRMPVPSLAMDAVLTFAHGANSLISQSCPGARGADAGACVERDTLFKHLSNVSFMGYTGQIKFDKSNDYRGMYIINQMRYSCGDVPDNSSTIDNVSCTKDLVQKTVAHYNSSNDSLIHTNITISWEHLLAMERVVPLDKTSPYITVPESVCSRPCLRDEYKISKELACCWDCRTCRENERIDHNKSGCKICDEFTWPDPATSYTTCRAIPLTYPLLSDILPVILTCLAILGITGTCLVIASYVYYHENRVIKAASRELSFLQLGGIFVGNLTVICFQTRPTSSTCCALYFMFCLSFAWLYSPLLVKTVRIYRIFQSGSKSNQRPRFISPKSQVGLSSLVIASQVILCLVMYILYHPTAKKTQPVSTENLVELSCDMTLPGLASFLVYNLVLVSACAMFAFKTRKLPDNFNESRFISMCVYTTLIIWLAFIPTYFTASRESLRGLLLSVSLLLNHAVAVLFLFLPKIYAIRYVDHESLIAPRLHTGDTSHMPSGSVNRVGVTATMTNASPRHGF